MDTKSTLEKIGPVYASSMAAKHDWSKFVKAVAKAKILTDANDKVITDEKDIAKRLKSELKRAKDIGLPIKDFDGQNETGGRGRAAKDYSEVAKLFGGKLDAAKHEEFKKSQKAAQEKKKPENIAKVMKESGGKLTAAQIKDKLGMRESSLRTKLDEMRQLSKWADLPELAS